MKKQVIHEFLGEINGVPFFLKETYDIASTILNQLEICFNIQVEDEDFTKEIRNEVGEAFHL